MRPSGGEKARPETKRPEAGCCKTVRTAHARLIKTDYEVPSHNGAFGTQ